MRNFIQNGWVVVAGEIEERSITEQPLALTTIIGQTKFKFSGINQLNGIINGVADWLTNWFSNGLID